jgi:hypothetical protein
MQSGAVGQLHDVVAPDRELGAQRVIGRVGVGDERVESVVAALQFDKNEDAVVIGAGGCGGERDLRVSEDRSGTREGQNGGGTKEGSTVHMRIPMP